MKKNTWLYPEDYIKLGENECMITSQTYGHVETIDACVPSIKICDYSDLIEELGEFEIDSKTCEIFSYEKYLEEKAFCGTNWNGEDGQMIYIYGLDEQKHRELVRKF
jgi:hypothetical protein